MHFLFACLHSCARYDPEGALATVPTVMSCWLGTHFGRVVKYPGLGGRGGGVKPLLLHWGSFAGVLMGVGLVIHFTAFPMNKQLWSPSYLFFMAGSCGSLLALFFAVVDALPLTRTSLQREGGPRWWRWSCTALAPLQ